MPSEARHNVCSRPERIRREAEGIPIMLKPAVTKKEERAHASEGIERPSERFSLRRRNVIAVAIACAVAWGWVGGASAVGGAKSKRTLLSDCPLGCMSFWKMSESHFSKSLGERVLICSHPARPYTSFPCTMSRCIRVTLDTLPH